METRRIITSLFVAFVLAAVCFCPACKYVNTNTGKTYQTLSGTIEEISKYGNVKITTTKAEMTEKGYEFGDVVTVTFADKSVDMPYCGTYSDVDAGACGVFGRPDDDVLTVAVNVGNFATIYGIADKITHEDKSYEWVYRGGLDLPVTFEISMSEKRGYYSEYVLRQLNYSDERSDYPNLTDEQFGNFRVVSTTGIKQNVLYRSATPVDPQKNRNTYVDAAAEKYGITVIIDLNDSNESLTGFENFDNTYFATTDFIALNMGLDFTEVDFKNKLSEGLKYMAGHSGVYLVHCLEGKDRTGFVIALLEFLTGASYKEAEADYMVTYYNYYGVEKGDEKYDIIATSNFEKNLLRSFGVSDVKSADLKKLATDYIKAIGLTEKEIAALKANIADAD